MLINHEVKNNENDSAGNLISKFKNDGRVRVRATADDNMTFSIDFYVENKDLFAHLLKPSVPYNISLVNTLQNFGGYSIIVCPCVFPDGIVNSITIPNQDVKNIQEFEIAFFGNTKNEFTGSTKWFYVNSTQFRGNDACTFNYINESVRKAIVPYSYNFVCLRINGTSLICREITELAQKTFKEADLQYKFYGDLSTLENIKSENVENKMNAEYIPYFQFDIIKGVWWLKYKKLITF